MKSNDGPVPPFILEVRAEVEVDAEHLSEALIDSLRRIVKDTARNILFG